VAALNALVPAVLVESDWPGAVVGLSAAWVAVLGCSASVGPDVLGFAGPDATVDARAAAGAGAGAGLTAPAAAPATPEVAGGVLVDTEAADVLGLIEDGVVGEVAGDAAIGEEVVADEALGSADGVASGEEVFAGGGAEPGE
jgi:hypothetical protein